MALCEFGVDAISSTAPGIALTSENLLPQQSYVHSQRLEVEVETVSKRSPEQAQRQEMLGHADTVRREEQTAVLWTMTLRRHFH